MCSLAKENEITYIKRFEAKTINLLSYYEQMNRKNDSCHYQILHSVKYLKQKEDIIYK